MLKALPSVEDAAAEELSLEAMKAQLPESLAVDPELTRMSAEEQKAFFAGQLKAAESLDAMLDEDKLLEVQRLAVNLKKSW